MNSKQGLDRIKELEDFVKLLKIQFGVNSWKSTLQGGETIQEIKQIYDEFKDGCYKFHKEPIKDGVEYYWCGKDGVMKKCPSCQKIKKIHFAILGGKE